MGLFFEGGDTSDLSLFFCVCYACISYHITNVVSFQLVIAALKCHKYDKSIQVTGSAALYYLTNTEYRSDQSVRLRREVIQVVLNGMEQYQEVTVSLHCGVMMMFKYLLKYLILVQLSDSRIRSVSVPVSTPVLCDLF